LFPEPPPEGSVPSCAEGGVLGVLAGMVGTFQANEALKLVLGIGTPLAGRLMLIDALEARTREVRFETDPACPLHGERPTLTDVTEIARVAREPLGAHDLAASELDAYLASHPATLVLDVREPHEAILAAPPRSVHVPASVLEARLHELDAAREYVVACRVGAKSQWALGRMRDAGFTRLRHLDGGLLAYAVTNDEFDVF
jgi:adenylyltransferase/sulfurtransferase